VPKVDTPMKSNDFFKSWSQPCSLRRIWTSVHTAFADSFERAGTSMMEFNLWESPKFDGWLSCLKIEMTILGIMCVLIPHFQAYPVKLKLTQHCTRARCWCHAGCLYSEMGRSNRVLELWGFELGEYRALAWLWDSHDGSTPPGMEINGNHSKMHLRSSLYPITSYYIHPITIYYLVYLLLSA
jgi:hypothetical protein